jgi:hypothetical protein
VSVSTLATKVQANNGREFDETAFLLIVIRASFKSKFKVYGKLRAIIYERNQSLVYDTRIGLMKVMA